MHVRERMVYLGIIAILGASTMTLGWYAIRGHHAMSKWVSQRARANSEVEAMAMKGIVVDEVQHCTVYGEYDVQKRELIFRGGVGPAVLPLDANYPRKVIHAMNTGCAGRIVPKRPMRRGELLSVVLLAIKEEVSTPTTLRDMPGMPGAGSEWLAEKILMPNGTLSVWLAKADDDKDGYFVYYSFNMLSGPCRELNTGLWGEVERIVEDIRNVE